MAATPTKPTKRSVRGSTTGRPIMALLDLLGRRWTLRILWELRGDPLTSRALREVCGDISPTVLQTRVDDLREAGLVELSAAGYGQTDLGRDLTLVFLPLQRFADQWSKRKI